MTAAAPRKYNPGFLSDDELVASFCVRTHEFESLVEALRGCTGDSNQHQIVIGPRGSGKTSLLLRVAAEVRRDADLAAGFFPIVFAEESYEVGTAGEFWLECLARLAIQAPQREDAPDLHATLADLRTIHDDRTLGERCLATLLDFADREGKRLVLMVENLSMMFRDMMDRDAGWRLRHVLQTEPRIILLASATSRFDEIDHPDHALYDQFRVLTLHPLTTAECTVLWETISGQSRPTKTIRSLEILTGGSPRLLAIVARFDTGLSFRDLMNSLLDLVDDHTEYFKSHVELLPAQERRVYLALADLWKPALAKEVAERARLETSKCSAQLMRLIQRGVVSVTGGSARRKQYYLSERMYNIYYLLRCNHGMDRIVKVLIRFMTFFYSPDKLKEIGTRTAREAEGARSEMRSLYQYASAELLAVSAQAHRLEEFVAGLGSADNAQIVAARTLFDKGVAFWEEGRYEDALASVDELLSRFSESEAPELLVLVATTLANKGVTLGALSRVEEELTTYDEVLRRFGDTDVPALLTQVAKVLVDKGTALGELNRGEDELAAYDEVLRRFGDATVPALREQVARALVNQGAALGELNRPDDALALCDKMLYRFGDAGTPALREQVAIAFFNKGVALGKLRRLEEEVIAYNELLRRFGYSGAPEIHKTLASALVNKGLSLGELNRREEELAAYDELLRRFRYSEVAEILEKVAKAMVNRGVALGALNRSEDALAAYDEVVCRFGAHGAPEIFERAADALVNKGTVLTELNRPAQPRDIATLLAILPKLNSPKSAFHALLTFSIDYSAERMREWIEASPAAELLWPLTTALEREMGLSPRVPEEISEIAEDIRQDLAKMRGARRA